MFFDNYELLIKYICDKNNEKEIYIWGVSVYGNYLGILLNEKKIKWSGYFDNYSVDINKQYNGKMYIAEKISVVMIMLCIYYRCVLMKLFINN